MSSFIEQDTINHVLVNVILSMLGSPSDPFYQTLYCKNPVS